jgi:hypothetical protein
MAKYLIKTACWVEDKYFVATPMSPLVIELQDKTQPSKFWTPLDKAAQAALLKIGVKRDISEEATLPAEETPPPMETMHDVNKRLVDRSPV